MITGKVRSVGISDPDGLLLVAHVSFVDDSSVDPKTGEAKIVASRSFGVDPGTSDESLFKMIEGHAQGVKASLDAASSFLLRNPLGN